MRLCFSLFLVSALSTFVFAEDSQLADLQKIDRSIRREPVYQATPHYALLVFGLKAQHRSWLVVDGQDVVYVDRNGNGDLTESDERVELDVEATRKINMAKKGGYKGMNVFPLGKVADVQLELQVWVRNPEHVPTNEILRSYYDKRTKHGWENSTLWRATADGSQAQIPVLLTLRPEDAQISRLGGPLTFCLKWGERQMLQSWPKQTVFDLHIGTPGVPARNYDEKSGILSPLTVSEIPKDVHPVATFDFPAKSADQPSISRVISLDRRCCGDTCFAQFVLPSEAGSGKAKVTVTYPGWAGLVEPAEWELPIEQELSRNSEQSFILFQDPAFRIEDAVNALRRHGVKVQINPGALLVQLDDDIMLGITLVRGKEVQDTATVLGKGTPHASHLEKCDARLEISFRDLDRVLKEKEMLTVVQSALQEATKGVIYNTWDKQLSGWK